MTTSHVPIVLGSPEKERTMVLKSSSSTLEAIRADFPILKRQINGKRLVYLDNAATTQKPRQVIDSISDYYTNYNANIHRSVHKLAEEATDAFEASREKTRRFLNARSREEVIFTKNATEALNIASRCISQAFLKKGDKIVVTEMEHHSNFVPWQQIAKNSDAKLEVVCVNEDCQIDQGELENQLKGARVFAFNHMSNVLGTINDAKKLTRKAHDEGAIVVVDGAQSAPHIPINVQDIDCDFFALSSHKMLGPTGVGVLYGKREILDKIPPFLYGGDMIREVHKDRTTWNDLPWKFEAGTSNIADVIGFGVALDYLSCIGMINIWKHEQDLSKEALEELEKLKNVLMYGPRDPSKRGAVFSFNVGNVHAHDVASILDNEGIAIRSGHHCAQILMENLQVPATSRASFYLYNGIDDLEALIHGIKHVSEVLS